MQSKVLLTDNELIQSNHRQQMHILLLFYIIVFIEPCFMPSKESKIEVEKRRKTRLDFSFLEKVFFFNPYS